MSLMARMCAPARLAAPWPCRRSTPGRTSAAPGRGCRRCSRSRLAERAGLEHRVHRHAHVLDPVERVEDAEHVDAAPRRLLHEVAHDVVGIVGVADRVGAAQQHLEQDVRASRSRSCASRSHGSSFRKRMRDVEGRPAPHSSENRLRQRRARSAAAIAQHVVRAHARGQQRLVRVAQRRVGEQHALLRRASTAANPSGPSSSQPVAACPSGAGASRSTAAASARRAAGAGSVRPFDLGVAVDGDVGRDSAAACVARSRRWLKREQLGRLVDERGGVARRRGRPGGRSAFSRNGMLVFTPRMRNSRSARSMRRDRLLAASAPRR